MTHQIPAPPLRAGMRRPAGLSHTTVRPDVDFETYSEAGYIWDAATNKWQAPPGASQGKKGLPIVGAAVYAQHPSTEVLCAAYDLKDGRGKQFWHPRMAPPRPLLDYVAAGGELEAWNTAFEWWIWNEVCTRRYGWPALPQQQTYDAMAKSRAHALPGALGKVSEVLALRHGKDPEGDRLLKKFAMPRNPTKSDPRRRIVPDFDDPDDEDAQRLKAYNLRDIEAEFEASWRTPDLCALELPIWRSDQRINRRGVAIDLDAVAGAIQIIEQAQEQYGQEMHALTGCYPTQLQQLKGWLGAQGVRLETMDEDAIEAALQDPFMPDNARRALEIRATVGSASIKKVFAMRNQVARGGRLHDLYTYHGAHTGRPTGNGPQPTNLPKAGPDVWKCKSCNHWHNTSGDQCPWCFAPHNRKAKPEEWNPGAMEDAIAVAKLGSLAAMEWTFTEAMLALAGTLRGLFIAAPGHDFISSDYSAIEGVVIAALAGEEWRLDVFRGHGMIYEMSAAKILGVPFDEFVQYKKVNGKHHPARQSIGKISELACLAADTLVLTKRGFVPLVSVRDDDEVNDGDGWVSHGGVVYKGKREVIEVSGVISTPDHLVFQGDGEWKPMEDLAASTQSLNSAIDLASTRLSDQFLSQQEASREYSVCARVNGWAWSTSTRSFPVSRRAVTNARFRKRLKHEGCTRKTLPKNAISAGSLRGFRPRLVAARTPPIGSTRSMVAGASGFTRSGSTTGGFGWSTYTPCLGGTTHKLRATALTTIVATNRETSASSVTGNNKVISDKRCGLSTLENACRVPSFGKSSALGTTRSIQCFGKYMKGSPRTKSSETKNCARGRIEKVYDLLNAGPNSRFVILTNSGPLIVHNCGFGGWVGAWKAFGADKYFKDDEEIKEKLLAWRAASPAIVYLWGGQRIERDLLDQRTEVADEWTRAVKGGRFVPCLYGLEGAAVHALQNPNTEVMVYRLDGKPTQIGYVYRNDVLYCRVPSGGLITYHRPRLRAAEDAWRGLSISYEGWNTNPKNGPPGWIRKDLYGGRMAENVVQRVARDIQMHAIESLEARRYPVVLHTYDEVVCEVPEASGSVDELEGIMATLPDWARGWPIKAAGGWRAKRYRKG